MPAPTQIILAFIMNAVHNVFGINRLQKNHISQNFLIDMQPKRFAPYFIGERPFSILSS